MLLALICCCHPSATYLKEENPTHWCQDNNVLLNVSKAKEMIVHFGKKELNPVNIDHQILGGESGPLQVPWLLYYKGHDLKAAYQLC